METIRLYRAISKREKQGIISFDLDKFDFQDGSTESMVVDEIYSHTLSTYNLRKGILYSFTDDLNVAYMYINKNPEKYFAVGYVDIDVINKGFCLPEGMLYLQRTCEFGDWLNLAELKEETLFKNLNYKTYPILIINTLIPGQKSVYSWAKSSREYVAVCAGLVLQLIDEKYHEPEWCKPYTKEIVATEKTCKHYETFKKVFRLWKSGVQGKTFCLSN